MASAVYERLINAIETLITQAERWVHDPNLGTPEWQALHNVADAQAAAMARAYRQIVDTILSSFNRAALLAALEVGDINAALAALAWTSQAEATLFTALAPIIETTFAEAAAASLTFLPADVQVGMSFNMLNPRAVTWIQANAGQLITDVAQDQILAIRRLIEQSFTEAIPPLQIARRIEDLIGLTELQQQAVLNLEAKLAQQGLSSADIAAQTRAYAEDLLRQRAEMIARTETIDAASAGQHELWLQARDQGLMDERFVRRFWLITPLPDERVCKLCRPIPEMNPDGVALEDPFVTPVGPKMYPTVHPQCLPGNVRVDASQILAISQRWYEGELITLKMRGGDKLACTPNHPVLTPHGWVAAGMLVKGDNLVCSRRFQRVPTGEVDDQHMPLCIEEIAQAWQQSGEVRAVPVPIAAEDFHGDGEGSEVAIIRTNCLLGDRLQPTHRQHLSQTGFHPGELTTILDTLREFDACLQCGFSPTGAGMRRSGLPLPLLAREVRPLETFSRRTSARLNAGVEQAPSNDSTTNPEGLRDTFFRHAAKVRADNLRVRGGSAASGFGLMPMEPNAEASLPEGIVEMSDAAADLLGQLGNGPASPVFLDEIVHVERNPFVGHVYNLQTPEGYYIAEGIITHNCRCAVQLRDINEP